GAALSFFFFFQAEDGIRDGHVTGVQTCALPILVPGDTATSPNGQLEGPSDWPLGDVAVSPGTTRRAQSDKPRRSAGARVHPQWRSEERRVGKEGRRGWARDP